MQVKALMILLGVALCSTAVWAQEETGGFDNDGQVDEDTQDDSASDGAEEEEEEEDLPIIPHPDITTTYLFPEFPDGRIQLGESVDMLVGVTNTGDKTFNFTSITGSLNSPYDFAYYIQNFTDGALKRVIQPGQKITIVFSFKPGQNIEPMELQFSAVVTYEDEDKEKFATVVYNRTTEFTEPSSEKDIESLKLYALYAAVALLLTVILYKTVCAKKPAEKPEGADDWLKAHSSNAPKKKAVGSPRSSKSKKVVSKKA